MKNKPYWKRRQEELMKVLQQSEDEVNDRLASYYRTEGQKLKNLIASYYQQYGDGNVIEYRTMLQGLSSADRELLFRDISEFVKKYPQYEHLVPTATSIYKLDRLEGLQASVYMQQLNIGAIEQEEVRKHLEEMARVGFDSVQKDLGIGGESINVIKTIVGVDWTGHGNYSDSIWKNKQKLTEYLMKDFSEGIARGDNYKKLMKILQDRFDDVSRRDAYRLVYTEGTHVLNESRARAMEQDFEYYKISCINDGKACDHCLAVQADQNAKPVKFKDRVTGLNFPPFHPWCRCSYVVVVPDEEEWFRERMKDRTYTEEQKRQAEELLKKFGG